MLRCRAPLFFTVQKGTRLGLAATDASRIIDAADLGTPKHKALRSRLIGAYQDYCRTLKGVVQ